MALREIAAAWLRVKQRQANVVLAPTRRRANTGCPLTDDDARLRTDHGQPRGPLAVVRTIVDGLRPTDARPFKRGGILLIVRSGRLY
jgi:hypothetical protein